MVIDIPSKNFPVGEFINCNFGSILILYLYKHLKRWSELKSCNTQGMEWGSTRSVIIKSMVDGRNLLDIGQYVCSSGVMTNDELLFRCE